MKKRILSPDSMKYRSSMLLLLPVVEKTLATGRRIEFASTSSSVRAIRRSHISRRWRRSPRVSDDACLVDRRSSISPAQPTLCRCGIALEPCIHRRVTGRNGLNDWDRRLPKLQVPYDLDCCLAHRRRSDRHHEPRCYNWCTRGSEHAPKEQITTCSSHSIALVLSACGQDSAAGRIRRRLRVVKTRDRS